MTKRKSIYDRIGSIFSEVKIGVKKDDNLMLSESEAFVLITEQNHPQKRRNTMVDIALPI